MKILKVIVIALVTVFTFSAAEAQVRVRATIGARPQHRTVVVRRPAYHSRVVVTNRGYHRGWHRRPVYRHHPRY
jgi:hypothetical protein